MSAPWGVAMLVAVALLLIATGLPAWLLLIAVSIAGAVAGVATGAFGAEILSALPARLIGLL